MRVSSVATSAMFSLATPSSTSPSQSESEATAASLSKRQLAVLGELLAQAPVGQEEGADRALDRLALEGHALEVRIVLRRQHLLGGRDQLGPGRGHLDPVLLEQVLAVVEEHRVGEGRQRHDLAVDVVGGGVGRQVALERRLRLAERLVERHGPAGRGELCRPDHVEHQHVERRILRAHHRVQILRLRLRGVAAGLDGDLHVRVLRLVRVEHLAPDVRAGAGSRRRHAARSGPARRRRTGRALLASSRESSGFKVSSW